ncbi:hypothetical protein BDN71DRAFT_1444939 [Pleurotus eryngii]|uniref:Uncharacterized protein n=1 Tax=Pleurotus eryngii TaxID=5323 RepID=A0A9P6DHH0_PLEER|nr:hypothetical protein BDN71DRAFT_1444939 [Pleurotus eryngii]
MSWTRHSPGPGWAVLAVESSDSSDEPVLEYYDGDVDGISAPQMSPPESRNRQRCDSPVQGSQGRREWHLPSSSHRHHPISGDCSAPSSAAPSGIARPHTDTPEKLACTSSKGGANTIEDGIDVDVIVISSSEGENHDHAFYYKPTNSRSEKPKPKSKSDSRRHQGLNRQDIVGDVEATTQRGKVVFIDPDIVELSDTPDPLPPAPRSRPSRPPPRPLYLARRAPSLPPSESNASPPPHTPRRPLAPPPPRAHLSLPTLTPQPPPKVQLVHSAPQPFRARKSAYLSTYTPTPACASLPNARFRHEQAARHVERGRKESDGRKKMKKLLASESRNRDRDAEANDVIELSDTPGASLDDFDSDPDFAAFEDVVRTAQKRKRRTSHQQSPSPSVSAPATSSSLKPMRVSKAFAREQYATNSGSWTSSARKSASTAAKTFERNEEW